MIPARWLVRDKEWFIAALTRLAPEPHWPVQSFVSKFKDEFVAKGVDDEARRAAAKNARSTAEMKIAASPTG